MPKVTRHQAMERQQELLEVWGFDLLAHVVEARRQYNQEVKQLRSHLGKGQTDTEQVPLDAILQHVKELQRSSALFSETLGQIVGDPLLDALNKTKGASEGALWEHPLQ